MASTGDGFAGIGKAAGMVKEVKAPGIIKEISKPRQGLTTARKSRKSRKPPSLLGASAGLQETLG